MEESNAIIVPMIGSIAGTFEFRGLRSLMQLKRLGTFVVGRDTFLSIEYGRDYYYLEEDMEDMQVFESPVSGFKLAEHTLQLLYSAVAVAAPEKQGPWNTAGSGITIRCACQAFTGNPINSVFQTAEHGCRALFRLVAEGLLIMWPSLEFCSESLRNSYQSALLQETGRVGNKILASLSSFAPCAAP
jgi:hypothetical protein